MNSKLTESDRAAAVVIARAVWTEKFDAEHPQTTKETRDEAWAQARNEYVSLGRRILRHLGNRGYAVSLTDAG